MLNYYHFLFIIDRQKGGLTAVNFDENILKFDEKAIFALRTLYSKHGYRQFRMSKFE